MLCVNRVWECYISSRLCKPGVNALNLACINVNITIHLSPRLIVSEAIVVSIKPIGLQPALKIRKVNICGWCVLAPCETTWNNKKRHKKSKGGEESLNHKSIHNLLI